MTRDRRDTHSWVKKPTPLHLDRSGLLSLIHKIDISPLATEVVPLSSAAAIAAHQFCT
ncbi:unnamed protein product [Dovyalis caffra]|uniref:Uncharacterized protein n=1 Tax=Dovyalis caffra TaxID=77055 RepID=A0AAV1R083_9ROSI|nr:unnamed protein product [Dovyalis caffra]